MRWPANRPGRIKWRAWECFMADRLSPQDWIRAGLEALATRGIDGVRVLPLAKALGVTRGSFYWHFTDRDALLKAMLEAWIADQTDGVIARAAADGGPPAEELRRLLHLCYEDDGALERAVRTWATTDPWVAEVLQRVDGRRIERLASLLSEAGAPHAEARARMGYRAWLGEYLLVGRTEPAQLRRETDELYFMLMSPNAG